MVSEKLVVLLWSVKLRAWLPKYSRNVALTLWLIALWLVAVIVPHYLIKNGHHPPVGTYIAIMGLLAALVSLRKDPSPAEKAAWIVLIALVMRAEIQNLYITDQEQAKTFESMQQRLSDTKGGLDETVRGLNDTALSLKRISKKINENERNSQKQFNITMLASKKVLTKTAEAANTATDAVANITGGDSYIVVQPVTISLKGSNTFPLFARIGTNCQSRTLEDVTISVRKLPIPNEGHLSDFIEGMDSDRPSNVVLKGTVIKRVWQPAGQITPDLTGETSYRVTVIMRNMYTTEILKVRRLEGSWEWSYTVNQDMLDGTLTHPETTKLLEETSPKWRRLSVILPP